MSLIICRLNGTDSDLHPLSRLCSVLDECAACVILYNLCSRRSGEGMSCGMKHRQAQVLENIILLERNHVEQLGLEIGS